MFGALAKTYYATKTEVDPAKMTVVSVMPCTAKKFECDREEMADSGFKDVDYVLTTRELARMIKQGGMNLPDLPDGEMDAPLGISSGAADIFANTGGVMEAALRTVYEIVTGRPLPFEKLHVEPLTTMEGVKIAAVTLEECVEAWSFLEGVEVRLAVAHDLTNAAKVLEAVKDGKETLHFVEVMTCPGGCIGGGGQPRFTTDEVRKARIQAIFAEDEGKPIRKSHDNPAVTTIYEEFLGEPLGHKSHELLHTGYAKKEKIKS
jgi:iron only hydrogenase large subunit-like protein